jgi:hypothetical protein
MSVDHTAREAVSGACVTDANLGRAPLVAITRQARREQIYKEYYPVRGHRESVPAIAKRDVRIELGHVVPETARKA